jgi:arabinogalactan oligomer/maltooligosaccharide transport system permease protein
MPTIEYIISTLGEVGVVVIGLVVITVALEFIVYLFLKHVVKTKFTIPYMLLAPAIVGLSLLVAFPIIYEFFITFSNMVKAAPFFRNPIFGLEQFVDNFVAVFARPILKQQTFFPLFFRTMLWTGIQVVAHVSGGLGIALLLNREIRGRAIYRTLLVIPWAIPQVVAVLAWRGEYHFQYGIFNLALNAIGMEPISWFDSWFWNIVAMNITNIWLGVPFMMVILLGGLQSIPRTYYEAAEIDGANAFKRFQNVTLPLLQPVMTPAVVLGIIWTFNNFNIPYFINKNSLPTSDILVTALYRAAFEEPNRYAFAAAFAFVIFGILMFISVYQVRITGALDDITRSTSKKKTVKKAKEEQAVAAAGVEV